MENLAQLLIMIPTLSTPENVKFAKRYVSITKQHNLGNVEFKHMGMNTKFRPPTPPHPPHPHGWKAEKLSRGVVGKGRRSSSPSPISAPHQPTWPPKLGRSFIIKTVFPICKKQKFSPLLKF